MSGDRLPEGAVVNSESGKWKVKSEADCDAWMKESNLFLILNKVS